MIAPSGLVMIAPRVSARRWTIDLPGTGYHVIDRVRLWGGGSSSRVRNFEVLVSSTTDDPARVRMIAPRVSPR